MLYLVQYIQLLERYRVDLVQRVQTRNVLPVTLYHVDYVIFSCITFYEQIRVVDLVLLEDRLDRLITHPIRLNHP